MDLERPLSRATSGREMGPVRRINSRMVLALIARSKLGVPTVSGRSSGARSVTLRVTVKKPYYISIAARPEPTFDTRSCPRSVNLLAAPSEMKRPG
jgi:hypothetical protein